MGRQDRINDKEHKFYVVTPDNRIASGWEFRSDAADFKAELRRDWRPPIKDARVVTGTYLRSHGVNPNWDDNWLTTKDMEKWQHRQGGSAGLAGCSCSTRRRRPARRHRPVQLGDLRPPCPGSRRPDLQRGTFVTQHGRTHPVKNLGYLLRNWQGIERIKVLEDRACNWDAILGVKYKNGRVYQTDFADRTVLHRWLDRPVLRGLPIEWDHEDGKLTRGTVGKGWFKG